MAALPIRPRQSVRANAVCGLDKTWVNLHLFRNPFAHKPAESKTANALDRDADSYVHPNLVQYYNSLKGIFLQVSAPVPAGTTILADVPYALTPSLDPSQPDDLICSNLKCRQRVKQYKESVRCQTNCIRDVAWCNIDCRTADQARHGIECAWLKNQGENLRQNEGQYTFAIKIEELLNKDICLDSI